MISSCTCFALKPSESIAKIAITGESGMVSKLLHFYIMTAIVENGRYRREELQI
jgi:hypothetical protein